jgi:hypothetical protein
VGYDVNRDGANKRFVVLQPDGEVVWQGFIEYN